MNLVSARSCGLAAALVLSCLQNVAAAAADGSNGAAFIDSVVVTATRTSLPMLDVLSPVTVIDQDAIATRQVVTFQELLAGEPGVQISNNGGLGKVSSVFLRGTNANHVLVLVDGVRMGSSTLGTTAFQYLPVDSIDRIEIVRGPLSSLYGSEAMGGVIQIFTRRPTTDGVSIDAEAAAGSHQTSSIGAAIGVSGGALSYGLSASSLDSDGYANCTGVPYISPSSPGGGCYVYDSTPDGYHNVSGSANVRYQFSEAADVEAAVLRAQGGTRYAGSYTNHEDFVQQAASLSAHWSATSVLRFTGQAGQSQDNALDKLDGVEPPGSRFDTTRNNASLQADWRVSPAQLVTLGGDYLRDHVSSDAGFPVTSRRTTGVFGEYQAVVGAQQLTLSARHDANSQFGGKMTGSAAWGYRFARDMRVTASFGTSFHAPSFDELYFPYFGNPSLKPETAQSFDIGLEQHRSAVHWSVHGFKSRIHDLIGYDAVRFAPENTDEARIRGVEFQGGGVYRAWSADLTANWLEARNRTPGSVDYGNLLPRRARGTGRIEVVRSWPRVRAAARVNVVGVRYDDLGNAQPLGGYTTADVLVEWTPVKAWTLQAKLANAADHRYETARYYPQDGRNLLITLRYRPIRR